MDNQEAVSSNPDILDRYNANALQLQSPLDCFHANAFLVLWNQFLVGNMTAHATHCATWFVTFGANSETGETLLYICLPLKLGGSKGVWPFYLIIKPDCVDLTDKASYAKIAKVVSGDDRFEHAGVETGAQLLRCTIKLKSPGFAAMPQPKKAMKPLSKHFHGLLTSLMSLSQALEFNIFLPTTAESHVQHFFEVLRRGASLSPEIDYKATLNGRAVIRNDWGAYGINDEACLTAAWNPLVDESPPSYDAIFGPEENIPDTNEGNQLADDPNQSLPGDNGDGLATNAPPDDNENEPATNAPPDDDNRNKRKANSPPTTHPTQKRVTFDESRSPSPSRSHTPPPPPMFTVPAPPATTRAFERRAPELLLHHLCMPRTSVFHLAGHNHHVFTPRGYDWFCEIANWLRSAWTREMPRVLGASLEPLMVLCRAIQATDREGFSRARLACEEVVFEGGEYDGGERGPWSVVLGKRRMWVRNWVEGTFGPGSDALVIHELRALEELAREWEMVMDAEGKPRTGCVEEFRRARVAFGTQMVGSVLVAVYKFTWKFG